MAGLGSDFVADRAADAAIEGFMEMGIGQGVTAALATTATAAAGTALAMAVPLVAVAGVVYVLSRLGDPGTPPEK